jgi:glycosyltransferase involved in cell wall biosynthesis
LRISFSTLPGNLNLNVGYGYAGFNMVRALQRLGHQVPFQDANCPVQIHFSQPNWYEFEDHQYKIGYTPWESSGLPFGWLEAFNKVDELWTPSPLMAQWYEEAGVYVPIKVYEHGVDHIWRNSRRRRQPGEQLKFLHHGEPAPRKGGQMAVDAFREAFGNQKDVHLTIKSHGASTVRAKKQGHIIGTVKEMFSNVSVVEKMLGESELIQLYLNHDVLVYPGWGEGFGLIPLQAMATGMPTICTGVWAPYQRLLLPELTLSATLMDSPWPDMHPGKMYEPSYEELVNAYRKAYEDFNSLAGKAYKNAFKVHEEYDWDNLTENAFEHIVEKFS